MKQDAFAAFYAPQEAFAAGEQREESVAFSTAGGAFDLKYPREVRNEVRS